VKTREQQYLEEAYLKVHESCISEDFVSHYDMNMKKHESGELSYQQWVDVSLKLLADIIDMKRKDMMSAEE
jgi:hypothetical protein